MRNSSTSVRRAMVRLFGVASLSALQGCGDGGAGDAAVDAPAVDASGLRDAGLDAVIVEVGPTDATASFDSAADGGADAGTGSPDGGASMADYTVGSFGYVDPFAPAFQPLSSGRVVRLEELVVATGDSPSGMARDGVVLDDAMHASAVLNSLPGTTLPENPGEVFGAAAGDLDGDGPDEAVMVSVGASGTGATLQIVVLDTSAAGVLATQAHRELTATGSFLQADVKVGDVDGDGVDEIVVSATSSPDSGGTADAGWVRVFDYANGAISEGVELHRFAAPIEEVRVEVADFDGDREEEIVLLGVDRNDAIRAVLLDDVNRAHAVLHTWSSSNFMPATGTWTVGYVNVVAANVDADPVSELVLATRVQSTSGSGTSGLLVRVEDDLAHDFALIAGTERTIPARGFHDAYDPTVRYTAVAAADTNADGIDELNVATIDDSSGNYELVFHHLQMPGEVGRYNGVPDVIGGVGSNTALAMAVTDDRTPDRGEVVHIVTRPSGTDVVQRARIAGVPSTANTTQLVATPLTTVATDCAIRQAVVAGGDFDGDSVRLSFVRKFQSLADPMPIAVISAPPVREGISQNENDSETAYGTSVTTGSSETHEIGTTLSATISFGGSIFDGLLGAEASATFEEAIAQSHGSATSVTYGTSYAGPYPDDYIVFQGSLYTSYEYEITGASDTSFIGRHITLDVPVATRVYKWTVPYFNATVGDRGLMIGPETLHHTAGDPSSYPTTNERDSLLLNGGWRSPSPVTVGQGSGANTATIDLGMETTTAQSRTITNSASAGVTIAGAGFEGSVGVSNSYVYELSVGQNTSFAGTVGDIAEPLDYTNYHYEFGLFTYVVRHPSGARFQVIDYWVDNLGPGYTR